LPGPEGRPVGALLPIDASSPDEEIKMTTTSLKQKNPSLLQRVRDRFRRDYDQSKPTSPQALSLTLALRRLWADHVIWTREYVVAAIADAPDAGAVAGRLLKNQEDLGNAVVPFYGQAAGTKLTDLLKEHIMIAVDLVAAAKNGDQAKFSQADAAWDRNAANIASFLASANPNWPEKDVADLLGQHLTLTKSEAVARLKGNWEDDIEAFDQIFTEILTVADVLAAGIIKQFPKKF
jgi:hypothetical protein